MWDRKKGGKVAHLANYAKQEAHLVMWLLNGRKKEKKLEKSLSMVIDIGEHRKANRTSREMIFTDTHTYLS